MLPSVARAVAMRLLVRAGRDRRVRCGHPGRSRRAQGARGRSAGRREGRADLVQELYEDIGHGNTDSMQALLDPEADRAARAAARRCGRQLLPDAILAIGMHADAKAQAAAAALKSAALGVFPLGRRALRVGLPDRARRERRALGRDGWLMSGTNELWSLDAAQLAATPVMATMKSGASSATRSCRPRRGVTVVEADASAAGAVEKFQKGLGDPHAWAADLEGGALPITRSSSAPPAGAGHARQEGHQGRTVEEAHQGEHARDARRRDQRRRDARPTACSTWVSAPIMRAEDGEDPMPLRAFAVFERAGTSWNLIGLQESVAVDAPAPVRRSRSSRRPRWWRRRRPRMTRSRTRRRRRRSRAATIRRARSPRSSASPSTTIRLPPTRPSRRRKRRRRSTTIRRRRTTTRPRRRSTRSAAGMAGRRRTPKKMKKKRSD